MKNVFIVTLGTREVQFLKEDLKNSGFNVEKTERGANLLTHSSLSEKMLVIENENYPDYFFPIQPRQAGEMILNNLDLFWSVILFPLITKSLEKIKSDNVTIHEVIVVYTDQKYLGSEPSQKRFGLKDTVNYKEILIQFLWKREFIKKDSKLSEIAITNKATDIDFQYEDFAIKCKSLFEEIDNINQIFLLPQGGIDQINHALTLQLIQAFGSKVKLWQQAEAEEPKELKFPFLFIQDLNKQKILKHLNDYDFGLIEKMTSDQPNIEKLSEFANRKLNLDYSKLDGWKYFDEDTPENRARDLYISCRIFLHKRDYANYLWRLFTLIENIYRIKVDKVLGDTSKMFKTFNGESVNSQWLDCLKSINGLHEYLSNQKLTFKNKVTKQLESAPIKFQNPNRLAYKCIFEFLLNDYKSKLITSENDAKNLELAYNLTEPLTKKRNELAHELKPISIEILNKIILEKERNQLHKAFDSIFYLSPQKPFGIYDDIKKEIESLL